MKTSFIMLICLKFILLDFSYDKSLKKTIKAIIYSVNDNLLSILKYGIITDDNNKEVYNKVIPESEHNKQLSLYLKPTDFSPQLNTFNNNIFYVTVSIGGIPDSQTDCGWDDIRTLGVVLNWHPIYQMGMQYMRNMVSSHNCKVPKNLIDYILRLKSFELALKTSNFALANSKFKEWFINNSPSAPTTPCGCR